MASVYTDKTLQSEHWPEPTQAAVFWERAKHWEQSANYWKARAESAERRMLEHHCEGDNWMQENRRPYIGHILQRVWTEDSGQKIDGIALIGGRGIAAHLTKPEAFALADRIVDAAEHLPDPAKVRQAQRSASAPRPRLTAADGTEEPPLPTSPAESE